MSVYTTVFAGSTPFGGLAMGGLASGVGTALAMAVGGAISVASGIFGLIWINRVRSRPPSVVARRTVEGAEAASLSTGPIGRS